jgi:hypothetical protein
MAVKMIVAAEEGPALGIGQERRSVVLFLTRGASGSALKAPAMWIDVVLRLEG